MFEIAYNRHDRKNDEKYQYGGTGVIAAGKMSNKVIKKGQDATGLGRWLWLLLEGKEHKKLELSAHTDHQKHRTKKDR